MRKLMFVTALVASVAAFADPITAINFEGYTAGTKVGNTYDTTDAGIDGDPRFVYDGTADDSTVKAYGADTLAAPAIRAAAFTNATENLNYLELSTGDGTLWRSIAVATSTTVDDQTTWNLGDPQTVGDGIYLDTLVQFTAWEDDAPTVGDTDKLAVWLSVTNISDSVVETNLMVTAGYRDAMSTFSITNYVLKGKTIEAGKWYRLTIKAVDDVVIQTSEYAIYYNLPTFEIWIDGDQMMASQSTFDTTQAGNLANGGVISEDTKTKFTDGKYFLSMVQGAHGTPNTLQAVGFQGTGAVDDIVWTNEDLFPDVAPSTVELTLTGGENATVAYVIGGETNTIGTISESWTTNIAANTEVVIMATPNTGYTYATEPEGWTRSGTEITYTLANITEATTVAVPSAVAENPTVDGQTVEPANVFNTAASDKPITYPSAPTIAVEEGGRQKITFNGVTVSVPAYYTAMLDGNVVSLELNTNALPVIGDAQIEEMAKKAIEVGATTFTTTLTSTNEKLYYGLKVATSPNAPDKDWTVGALTKGTGAAMQIQMDKPTVSENPASAGFFKVYVTDIAPAAGE